MGRDPGDWWYKTAPGRLHFSLSKPCSRCGLAVSGRVTRSYTVWPRANRGATHKFVRISLDEAISLQLEGKVL